jgi:hypothetical protein
MLVPILSGLNVSNDSWMTLTPKMDAHRAMNQRKIIRAATDSKHVVVAQTSKSAVSRVSQSAGFPSFPRPADFEVGDWLARSRSLSLRALPSLAQAIPFAASQAAQVSRLRNCFVETLHFMDR